MLGITGYGHVAIKVKYLDRTLAFYCGRLGLPEMFRLHHDDGSVMLVYLRITDGHYLEVFPRASGDRAPGDDANGIHHMCLTVEDMAATVRRIEAAGIGLSRPVTEGLDGNRQAWIEDPDGNRIELMEMHPDSLQHQAIARLAAGRD